MFLYFLIKDGAINFSQMRSNRDKIRVSERFKDVLYVSRNMLLYPFFVEVKEKLFDTW